MTIIWNDETMTIGMPQLDEEHREWVRRFNQFDMAFTQQQELNVVHQALYHFAEYAKTHFPHEEALMDKYKVPVADLNRAEHNRFREKLQQIETLLQTDASGRVEAQQLKMEMQRWMIDHICQVDTHLGAVAKTLAPASHKIFTDRLKTSLPGNFVNTILQSSPDAIIIVDSRGNIIFASGRCQDLLGYAPSELIGQPMDILVPPQYSRHTKMSEKYRLHPEPRAMGKRPILSAQHKSGNRIPVDIALSPLPSVPGLDGLVEVVIRDAMPRWNTQLDLMVQSVAMNAAANGIVLTDTRGVIQWVNPAVTRMTGYSSGELIGKTPSMFKSGLHDDKFYRNLWATIMTGQTWFGEIINRRKDGTIYYEEQHIAPVRNEDGQITRLIAIKQDVTARRLAEIRLKESNQELEKQFAEVERLAGLLGEANKELENKVAERTAQLESSNQALERANKQLQELDNLKSSFLGVISHELRTPFASIGLLTQLIESHGLGQLQPEQRELFGKLNANIDSARAMIENLVNFASFVRKQGELRLAPVRMSAMVDKSLLAYKFQADRKNIAIKTIVPADLPIFQGDEERLMDAVSQLVDNAIKFTPAGGRILVRCWQAGDMLHLAVQDTGVGVPPEKLAGLWESFAQMADPMQRGREGLGLGLALVDYIIHAHRGQVWAESQVGLGSTFGFRLPLK